MKLATTVVALVATVATASPFFADKSTSTIDPMPKCAYQCLVTIIAKATDCSIDDYKCMCRKKNQAEVMKYAPKCIFRACSTAEAMKAKAVAEAHCKAVRKAVSELANNTTIAQNTTVAQNTTTVHGMAAIGENSTANKTLGSA
ncbi:hypothetical protein MY11210_003633 [Beauveria gryllotalpidicola]